MSATTALGVNYTLIAAGGESALLRGLVDGRVKTMLDYYTILGSETTGSTIRLGGVLPTGANVIGIVLTVSVGQSSATFSIGDGASATRYANASTSLQTAGTYLIGGLNYVVGTTTSDNYILLTTGSATLTGAVLYAAILYTQD